MASVDTEELNTGLSGPPAGLIALIERFDPEVIDLPSGSARIRLAADGEGEWDAVVYAWAGRCGCPVGSDNALSASEPPGGRSLPSRTDSTLTAYRLRKVVASGGPRACEPHSAQRSGPTCWTGAPRSRAWIVFGSKGSLPRAALGRQNRSLSEHPMRMSIQQQHLPKGDT